MTGGCISKRMMKCGNPYCACNAKGKLHGPYYILTVYIPRTLTERQHTRQFYIGKGLPYSLNENEIRVSDIYRFLSEKKVTKRNKGAIEEALPVLAGINQEQKISVVITE